MTKETSPTNYQPGICNINPREIASRRRVGYIGLATFVGLLLILLMSQAPPLLRVILFIPAIPMFSGFLQAKNKFCVGYGAAGMQNADGDDLAGKTVTNKSALAKDKAQTRRINTQTIIAATVATALTLFF